MAEQTKPFVLIGTIGHMDKGKTALNDAINRWLTANGKAGSGHGKKKQ